MMKVKRRLLAFFFSVLMIWQGFFFAEAEGEDFAVSVSTEMLSSEREEIENPDLMNGDDRNREAEDISSSNGIESNERDLDEEKRSLDEGYIEEDGMQGGAILPEENALPTEEENNVQAVRADHAIIKEEPALFSKEPVNGKIQKVKDTGGADHYLLEYVIRFNAKKYSAKLDEYNAFEVQDILNVGTESGGHRLKFFDPKILNSGFRVEKPEKYMPSYRRGVWRSGWYKKGTDGKEVFEAAEDDTEHRGQFYELLDNAEEINPDDIIPADPYLGYNSWNDDAKSFRNTYYNFSSHGGFELRYFVEIDEIPVNGAKYTNKAKLYDVNNDSTLADIDSDYTVTDKSGSFQNDGVKIVIKKTDREGKALEGAEFLLSGKNASFEMEVRSNKDGIAEFPRLLQRDYKIEEMNPPEGYFLDRRVYEVKKELFNTNSTVLLTIANDRLDSDHRNIIVEKRWLLEPHCPPDDNIVPPPKAFRPSSFFTVENPFSEDANEEINGLEDTEEKTESQLENIVADAVDSEVPEDQSEEEWNRQDEEPSEEVTIILLANGQEVKRVTLSRNPDMDKNYRHIFENLPRKDENGFEIVYTIKEEAKEDSGYQSIISGTADTKFTITNYHKNADLIPISVTKIWEGTGPHPNRLAVYLYENDQVISKFTLSARNDWQHIFLVPAYKLQDSSIRYEVREAALKDYEGKRVSGEDGRTFVFTNKKKPKPPVPDTEDNPPDVPHNPPDNPGGGGGTPPNNPGGGRPPRVIEIPPANGTTPPPTTPDAPGEVLGTKRSTPKSNEETKQVLSAGREPKVLGQGRGWTKTSDSSAMRIYLVLFLFSLIGLSCSYICDRRKIRNKR